MEATVTRSSLQDAMDTVEALPEEEQRRLMDILGRRLAERDRRRLVSDVEAARDAYRRGDVRRGSVADLMAELMDE